MPLVPANDGPWNTQPFDDRTPSPYQVPSGNSRQAEHEEGGGCSVVAGAVSSSRDAESSSAPDPIPVADAAMSQIVLVTTDPGAVCHDGFQVVVSLEHAPLRAVGAHHRSRHIGSERRRRVGETERLDDVLGEQRAEVVAADGLEGLAQQHVVRVGIAPRGPGG